MANVRQCRGLLLFKGDCRFHSDLTRGISSYGKNSQLFEHFRCWCENLSWYIFRPNKIPFRNHSPRIPVIQNDRKTSPRRINFPTDTKTPIKIRRKWMGIRKSWRLEGMRSFSGNRARDGSGETGHGTRVDPDMLFSGVDAPCPSFRRFSSRDGSWWIGALSTASCVVAFPWSHLDANDCPRLTSAMV